MPNGLIWLKIGDFCSYLLKGWNKFGVGILLDFEAIPPLPPQKPFNFLEFPKLISLH